jgi:RHS repeat-associated protein
MFRRSNRWHSSFDQPDPSDGSYDAIDPQSFNRYAYVQGDPVNFVDPQAIYWPIARVSTKTLDAPSA